MSEIEGVYLFDLPENSRMRIKDLVRLKAFGVSLVPNPNRPLLILKDETGTHTLPVPLNPLEAGVTLTQFNKSGIPVTPHRVAELLMESLDLSIEKCVFVEIRGHYQMVRLFIKNHPHLKSLKMRAEEAMSLCLHLEVPVYATREIILASRELSLKLTAQDKDQGLAQTETWKGYVQ